MKKIVSHTMQYTLYFSSYYVLLILLNKRIHLKIYFRKFYFLDPEESVGNPDETFITVPNIPLITALSSARVNINLLKYFTVCKSR